MVKSRSRRTRDRVMCNEDLVTRKTERGILLRTALTVRDQRVELLEEGTPALSPQPSLLSSRYRAQPPANDGFAASPHPPDRSGRRKVTRVGFDDQRIRLPIPEPVAQSKLIAKVKTTA